MNYIQKEFKYASNNYKSIARVMIRGQGIYVYDQNNKAYIDCISGYSALNQGHCHPTLIKEMNKQSKLLTLTSRAYHNNKLGEYSELLCKTFDYDKVLLMNGGIEAGESSIKIERSESLPIASISLFSWEVLSLIILNECIFILACVASILVAICSLPISKE